MAKRKSNYSWKQRSWVCKPKPGLFAFCINESRTSVTTSDKATYKKLLRQGIPYTESFNCKCKIYQNDQTVYNLVTDVEYCGDIYAFFSFINDNILYTSDDTRDRSIKPSWAFIPVNSALNGKRIYLYDEYLQHATYRRTMDGKAAIIANNGVMMQNNGHVCATIFSGRMGMHMCTWNTIVSVVEFCGGEVASSLNKTVDIIIFDGKVQNVKDLLINRNLPHVKMHTLASFLRYLKSQVDR